MYKKQKSFQKIYVKKKAESARRKLQSFHKSLCSKLQIFKSRYVKCLRLVGWLVGFWCTHFRDLAPLINSLQRLSLNMDNGKRWFWKFVKAQQSNSNGIGTLKLNGDTFITDEEKGNLLNSTFQSHFINETSKNIPPLKSSHLIPDMPPIRVSEGSVKTMLLKVDTSKASGPDGITPSKSWVEVLSPSIVALFNKSLSRGEIPGAWL